ncbi:MAG: hypothetical protein GY861_18640 [bacterium]|nr:hypothetical protein [bacterium]
MADSPKITNPFTTLKTSEVLTGASGDRQMARRLNARKSVEEDLLRYSYVRSTALIDTFTGLTDTPSAYASQSKKAVRVNNGETALEFFSQTFLWLTDVPDTYTAHRILKVNATGTALEYIADSGANGTFNDGDANTVTVTDGIITSLS